jgi:GNAT superfamily N-acetyltransferase
MLFADTGLAARIEQAECSLLADSVAAIGRRRADGAFARSIAGGLAVYVGPDSPLNKVCGLGFAGGFDREALERELDAVEREFVERGAPVQVELSCLAASGIAALLTRRGYLLVGFENVLGRRLPADGMRPPSPGVEVAPCGPEELSTWIDVVATGFAAADEQGVASHESFPREALDRTMRDFAAVAGVVRYLARRDGVIAGGASLRIHDGVCGLHGAATLPEHRRRGIQSAMLARRLADAARAGCDVAVVTTLPGSKSQQNVQRLGFDLLYTRAILVLER